MCVRLKATLSVSVVLEKRLSSGNDGEIYKTTTACAHETGIEIVKVREKDVRHLEIFEDFRPMHEPCMRHR